MRKQRQFFKAFSNHWVYGAIAFLLSYLGIFLYRAIGGNLELLTALEVDATMGDLFTMPIGATIIGAIPYLAGRITYAALGIMALICLIPNPVVDAAPQDAVLVLSMLSGLMAGLNIRLGVVDDIL
ncbi:MAG: hypothetical protein AAF685_03945 [Cyanobacteria bacterium P01_C01_bin.89]